MAARLSGGPGFWTWAASDQDLQAQADVAVVMPTILRPSLERALDSVFSQAFDGRIQLLVGVDKPVGSLDMLDAVCARAPAHCTVQALYPGYSTSVRHGGVCEAKDGGALRSVLSYLANAPLIAYLDDDNWWAPHHLASLTRAIPQADWAFSLRWFTHPQTLRVVCVDTWESVGPGAGVFNDNCGGFVDPNCLMIRRAACADAIPWWTVPLPGDEKAMSADRHVFAYLSQHHKGAGTGEASVYYRLDPGDAVHAPRLSYMGEAYERAGATDPAEQDP